MYEREKIEMYIGLMKIKSIVLFKLGSPEGQIVSDQLHDGGGILVLFFLDLVNVGNGLIEGFLGKLAGSAGVVLNFVVENRVVKSQAQSNGVGGLEVTLGNFRGSLVGFVGIISGLGVGFSAGVLRDVSVVVTLHLVVEDLGFGVVGLSDELVGDQVKDLVAVFVELSLNLLLVALEEVDVLGSLLLLFLLD